MQGRYVLMPRGDERFVGTRDRARARARERRRRVLSVLGEALAFTVLIGAFPPLRAMWFVSAILVAALAVYLIAVLRLRAVHQGEVVGQTIAGPAPDGPRTITLPDTDLVVLRSARRAPADRAVS